MSRVSTTSVLALALMLCVAPMAMADQLAGNGGFEIAGVGGATDSAMWFKYATSQENVSERTTTNPATGSYSHHLYAEGMDGLGTVAGVVQNSLTDVGLDSLAEGTVLNASFDAITPFGTGGVMNYSLRILDSNGGIVAATDHTVTTSSSSYSTYTTSDLTVPAFGAAPNDAYSAFIEINVAAGGFIGSTAEAYIDNVQINGTLIPEPASLVLLALGALLLRRR